MWLHMQFRNSTIALQTAGYVCGYICSIWKCTVALYTAALQHSSNFDILPRSLASTLISAVIEMKAYAPLFLSLSSKLWGKEHCILRLLQYSHKRSWMSDLMVSMETLGLNAD